MWSLDKTMARDGAHAPVPPPLQSRMLLERHGLRSTRQRRGLAKLLFGKGNRHLTAEMLANEAEAANTPVSLATVYNVLNLFARVGLIRNLPIEAERAVFDTNTTDHAHFYYEDTGEVRDVSSGDYSAFNTIEPPPGYEIARVDVVVRLRPKAIVTGDGRSGSRC